MLLVHQADGGGQRILPSLAPAFLAAGLERSFGTRIHAERSENGGHRRDRSLVLAMPNVPIFCLDAKNVGSFFEFALIRRTATQRPGLKLAHVIIGSWMMTLSFNPVFPA